MNKSMAATERKWEIEDDVRSLKRAQEVHDDPKRLKAALKMLKEEASASAAVIARESKGLRNS